MASASLLDVLNYLVLGSSPTEREVVRLLLQHGAEPNAVHPATGFTPMRTVYDDLENLRTLVEHGADIDHIQPEGVPAIVHFIGSQQWDMALYLIEKGANLNRKNEDGLSVDYYLNDWKESVYGAHPTGWDSVRAAISKHRAERAGVR